MHETLQAKFMALALALAAHGRGRVSPNPMVGCVIVKNGQIVGQGWHQYAGGPHAEIVALTAAGAEAREATVYLNLEPCCHHGKTPPCTQALIAAAVKKVYVSCLDPNPLVAGQGVRILREHGIVVEIGLAAAEANALNEVFFHYMRHNKPWVIAKWALSLNGRTTGADAVPQISGAVAHSHTHELRQQVDAIVIGAGTALADNPRLTARLADGSSAAKQPWRVIISGKRLLPLHLHLLSGQLPGQTMIVTTRVADRAYYQHTQAIVLVVPALSSGVVSLPALLSALAQCSITSLLVEGGMRLHNSFFTANLVNKVEVYLAPWFINEQGQRQQVLVDKVNYLGDDIHIMASGEADNV
jgi:diaminohydroxyphosphoribosylaminopyrimidine deaminase/5-amino-6-(5-phosphoribosylamino)uracil reductase